MHITFAGALGIENGATRMELIPLASADCPSVSVSSDTDGLAHVTIQFEQKRSMVRYTFCTLFNGDNQRGAHLRLTQSGGSGLLLLLLLLLNLLRIHSLRLGLAPRLTADTWRPLGGRGLGLRVLQLIQLLVGQTILVPVGAEIGCSY